MLMVKRDHEKKRNTFDFTEFIEKKGSDPTEKLPDDTTFKGLTIEGIGGIAIPKVSLSLNIFDGVSEEAITYGAGTDVEDRQMGKGNFVLASHDLPTTFGRLYELAVDDLIYTVDATQIYTYKIVSTFVAQDSDVRDIKRVRGDVDTTPILTLYTCLGAEGTPTRTVVQAVLTKQDTIENSPSTIIEYFR